MLQVACALLLSGETSVAKFEAAKEVLVQMGTYFQVQVRPASFMFLNLQLCVCISGMPLKLHYNCVLQDDFLDCYGAPEVIGKVRNCLKLWPGYEIECCCCIVSEDI